MALLIAAGTSTQSSVWGGGVLVASASIFLSDFSFVAYRILFLVDTCFWACVNTLASLAVWEPTLPSLSDGSPASASWWPSQEYCLLCLRLSSPHMVFF